MIRFDLIFSYWIFAWYLLYINGVTKYSPKSALYAVLLVSCWLLVIMCYYNIAIFDITVFIILVSIMKVVPLWTLRKELIRTRDIYAALVLFGIYQIYVHLNGWTFDNQYKLYISFKDGNLTTPFISFLRKYSHIGNK